MSFTSLLLILGSACIHVVTHVVLKRANDRLAFVWWMLVWGAVLYSPILWFGWQAISPLAWGILIVSSVFEALYFGSIAQAYKRGDLSLVYPLARGVAPVFLLAWSVSFLREHLTLGGVAGVGLIAAGLYLINLPRLGAWSAPLRSLRQEGPRWALLAGWATSLYTVLDKIGVSLVTPLLYTYLSVVLAVVYLAPVAFRAVGWGGLRAELRSSRLDSVIAGLTTIAAYSIVLYAIRTGTPASYAGALREVSVVFGAIVGVLFMGEPAAPMRILGSLLVGGGVGAIALFG